METRPYQIVDDTTECKDVIATGIAPFYHDPVELIPKGYKISCVYNKPDMVTIYVQPDN